MQIQTKLPNSDDDDKPTFIKEEKLILTSTPQKTRKHNVGHRAVLDGSEDDRDELYFADLPGKPLMRLVGTGHDEKGKLEPIHTGLLVNGIVVYESISKKAGIYFIVFCLSRVFLS
ncbi:hypothetical protein MMC21_000966 [Puttea exsequens]|nr:hypothetical protein [Puttea exsequens]